MKKIIILLLTTICFVTVKCQLNASFEKDTLSYERDKLIDQVIHLQVNISGLNSGGVPANTLSFAINPGPATNMAAGDYSFTVAPINLNFGVTQVNCPITLMHGTNASGNTLFISIQMSYTNTIAQTKSIVLKISNKEDDTKAKNKAGSAKILILNAYNFDFGSTGLTSNYVGHLNFYFPSSSKGKDPKWGFNAGIMKVNYGQKDTSNGVPVRENVFVNPFDTVATGLKYLRQINAYKTEKRNTVWSFYVQGLYELTKKEDDFHVYAHAHMELLASRWSSTTTITNIKQDTGIISQPSNSLVLRSAIQSSSTYSVNSLAGYFGGGLTFDVKPWDGGSFFFQPTIGLTSNKPSPSSVDINSSPVLNSNKDKPRIWNGFYLVRTYFKQDIAEDKATAVIGVDIRGLLPLYAPQYAAYIGLNLTLKSIVDLFKKDK